MSIANSALSCLVAPLPVHSLMQPAVLWLAALATTMSHGDMLVGLMQWSLFDSHNTHYVVCTLYIAVCTYTFVCMVCVQLCLCWALCILQQLESFVEA